MERTKLIECRGEESRQMVSEKLEITPQMLGAIERGDRTPSLPLAKKIADYYGLSVDEIFFNQNRHSSFPEKDKTNKEKQQAI